MHLWAIGFYAIIIIECEWFASHLDLFNSISHRGFISINIEKSYQEQEISVSDNKAENQIMN